MSVELFCGGIDPNVPNSQVYKVLKSKLEGIPFECKLHTHQSQADGAVARSFIFIKAHSLEAAYQIQDRLNDQFIENTVWNTDFVNSNKSS